MKNLTWIVDPSHAWLRVPLKQIIASGIAPLISEYSYYNRNHVYLEEDCDAPLYLDTVKGDYTKIPETQYDDAPCRAYLKFTDLVIMDVSNFIGGK